jgi:hypothetical protein
VSIPGITHTTGQIEWWTPEWLWQAAADVMGWIDLDPCSNSHENPTVPCPVRFTQQNDGLSQVWFGKMYMNPPWGRGIEKWVRKAVESYEQGGVTQAVLAVPASTETKWFSRLWNYPICFSQGRCFFIDGKTGDVPPNGGPTPVAYIYLGDQIERFNQVFSQFGPVVRRMELPAEDVPMK